MNNNIVYLMYHSLTHQGDVWPPSSFHRNKYTVADYSLNDHLALIAGSGIIPTFDDGHVSVREIALPLLLKHDVRFKIFVTAALIDSANWLTKAHIREAANMGAMLGSHGLEHVNLTKLSQQTLLEHLRTSKGILEDILGQPVAELALVGGHYDSRVIHQARVAGYDTIYCSQPGLGLNRHGLVKRNCIYATTTPSHLQRLITQSFPFFASFRYEVLSAIRGRHR
jgi:peptidoglycan/xylan/chitin deacetylase (PgdA/CDA1 family)